MTIRFLPKGLQRSISKHVQLNEIECPCTFVSCTGTIVVKELFEKFEQLREKCGSLPLVISSGYRCPMHNRKIDGASVSQHMPGLALDIIYPKHINKEEFVANCKSIFDYVNVYEFHVHVDCRNNN